MCIQDEIGRILTLPGVVGAYSLDPRTLYKVIGEESVRKNWLGIPLYNEAAKTCLSRKHTVCVFSEGFVEPLTDGFIAMIDDNGIEIGKYVCSEEKELYMNNKDNIWLSKDFVLFPYKMTDCPMSVRMRAIKPTFLGTGYDVSSASLFYPCEKTDRLLKSRYGLDPESKYSSAILGLEFLPQQAVEAVSAEYIKESF